MKPQILAHLSVIYSCVALHGFVNAFITVLNSDVDLQDLSLGIKTNKIFVGPKNSPAGVVGFNR